MDWEVVSFEVADWVMSSSQIIPTRLNSKAAMVNRGLLVSMAADTTLKGHEMRETRAKSASL